MIRRLRLGFTNCYLLSGDRGYLLIDTGIYGSHRRFFRKLARNRIQLEQIVLILITHAHYDHVGSLQAIKTQCGCPVAAHTAEALLLKTGQIVIPPGTNSVTQPICRLASRNSWLFQALYGFEPVEPEITITTKTSLEPYGFKARVIPTPGHTQGSVSVLTPDGDTFVGDLAFNLPLLGLFSKLPPFGTNPHQIHKSWQVLLRQGASVIYPAHGLPFKARRLQRGF